MVTYDNYVMPEAVRKAARKIRQACEQNGCLYCPFHTTADDEIGCMFSGVPREWDMKEILEGGNNNA